MMATIDLFAALPRWSTTVSDDARPKTHPTTMQADPEPECGAKHRLAISVTNAPMPSSSNCSFKNQQAAALKSP